MGKTMDAQEQTSQLLLAATRLYEQGNYRDALSYFRTSLALYPNAKGVYVKIGDTLLRLDRATEAVEAFQKAIDENPKDESAYVNISRAFYGLKDARTARYWLERGVKANPRSHQLLYNLAIEYEEEGALGRSANLLEKAVELNPNFALALVRLGNLYWRFNNRYKRAAACYRRALKADPNNTVALENLARACRLIGNENGERRALARLLKLNPGAKTLQPANPSVSVPEAGLSIYLLF